MWERPWTDSRDGKTWFVRTGQGNPAMGVSAEVEAALRQAPPGKDWISFRSDDDPFVHGTDNPGGRTANEFTDDELQELLDRAKAETLARRG